LVQFAPLVLLALFLAAWFAVPSSVRYASLQQAAMPRPTTEARLAAQPDPELTVLLALDEWVHQPAGSIAADKSNADSRLEDIGKAVTGKVMSEAWRLHDSSGALKSFPLPENDPAFSALSEYEKRNGARLFAFAIPARPNPPVALSAVASLSVLTPSERKEFETSGTLELLRHHRRGQEPRTLPVDARDLNSGNGDGPRRLIYGAVEIRGHFYEVYALAPLETDQTGGDYPTLSRTAALDSPENRRAIRRLADNTGGAVFVVGPTDATPVPLRAPMGATASQRAALTGSAGRYLSAVGNNSPLRPARLEDSALAGHLGSGAWIDTVVSAPDLMVARSGDGRSAMMDPMLFVAVWGVHPDIATTWDHIGRTPVRQFWVWLGVRLPFVLSALGVLLVVSLLASPVAFVRERRLTSELEIEREQERVRRAARENVVRRLTELSARIDRAAAQASDASRGDVVRTARDIDATVADLRRILGELTPPGERNE
jgi:hypothetical protein